MKIKKKKWLIPIVLLLSVLSPFILIVVFGTLFSLIRLFTGAHFTDSFSYYLEGVLSLSPYYPYLTTIPLIAVLIPLFIKFKRKRAN